ncbi:MAG: DUF6017 domain-containing protein, partial [Firmicutes bacterium]|nr:DUF6017 domain-containing protein [Bacillota bacterium]
GMDRMDERSEYEEIIKENLDYGILCQDPKFDKDRFREIMDIMLDAVCSTAPTIRINGEDMPQQVLMLIPKGCQPATSLRLIRTSGQMKPFPAFWNAWTIWDTQ